MFQWIEISTIKHSPLFAESESNVLEGKVVWQLYQFWGTLEVATEIGVSLFILLFKLLIWYVAYLFFRCSINLIGSRISNLVIFLNTD